MKRLILFSITAAVLISLMNACGPSDEEIKQKEKARKDSLARVEQQRLQQQRMDSIAQARQDSMQATQKEEKKQIQVEFDPNGPFAVQVEAWRSEVKAQAQVSKWKDRGFENAYVVEHGNPDTGDVWFRVRLGRFASMATAEQFQDELQTDYQAKSWVSNANDASKASGQ